jgi:Caspase domain
MTETPGGRRLALVVAVSQYVDPALRRLRAPAGDAISLRDVLADPEIGAFEVTSVLDQGAQQIRLAVEEFLTDRRPEDLLLVYLSCHGLVDLRRRLYFAARDTTKNRLAASGVESHWLLDQLEDCRARRQVVVLDCCFSGAFAQGAKGESDLALGERLLGQGRGRVVLTASRGTEYSFEGDTTGDGGSQGSVFTNALVAGIRSGAADSDQDGYISVDDAYAYAFEQVRRAGAQQTPQRWLYGAEGGIVLARNPVRTGEPGDRPMPEVVATPPVDPVATEETMSAGTRHRLSSRARVVVIAVAVVASAAVASTVALLSNRDGTPDPGSGSGAGSSSTSGVFTATGPWRILIRDERQHDTGCDITVSNTDGDGRNVTELYGTNSFQVPGRGRFRWTSNDPGCLVVQHKGPGDAALPFLQPIGTGDTDAFRPKGKVSVKVTDFAGSDSCELQLASVDTGRPVDLDTATPERSTVVLDPNGLSPVYLAEPECVVRVSEAG